MRTIIRITLATAIIVVSGSYSNAMSFEMLWGNVLQGLDDYNLSLEKLGYSEVQELSALFIDSPFRVHKNGTLDEEATKKNIFRIIREKAQINVKDPTVGTNLSGFIDDIFDNILLLERKRLSESKIKFRQSDSSLASSASEVDFDRALSREINDDDDDNNNNNNDDDDDDESTSELPENPIFKPELTGDSKEKESDRNPKEDADRQGASDSESASELFVPEIPVDNHQKADKDKGSDSHSEIPKPLFTDKKPSQYGRRDNISTTPLKDKQDEVDLAFENYASPDLRQHVHMSNEEFYQTITEQKAREYHDDGTLNLQNTVKKILTLILQKTENIDKTGEGELRTIINEILINKTEKDKLSTNPLGSGGSTTTSELPENPIVKPELTDDSKEKESDRNPKEDADRQGAPDSESASKLSVPEIPINNRQKADNASQLGDIEIDAPNPNQDKGSDSHSGIPQPSITDKKPPQYGRSDNTSTTPKKEQQDEVDLAFENYASPDLRPHVHMSNVEFYQTITEQKVRENNDDGTLNLQATVEKILTIILQKTENIDKKGEGELCTIINEILINKTEKDKLSTNTLGSGGSTTTLSSQNSRKVNNTANDQSLNTNNKALFQYGGGAAIVSLILYFANTYIKKQNKPSQKTM